MRKLLVAILRAFGCRKVTEATNGREAIEIFPTVTPDVLISDWLMHPVDGLELTHFVRTSRVSPNPFLPIILVTGLTSPGSVFTARDSGVTEVLAKPVSAKALFQRIQRIVWQPRQFVRNSTFFGPDRRRHESKTYRGADRRQVVDLAIGARSARSEGQAVGWPGPGQAPGRAQPGRVDEASAQSPQSREGHAWPVASDSAAWPTRLTER